MSGTNEAVVFFPMRGKNNPIWSDLIAENFNSRPRLRKRIQPPRGPSSGWGCGVVSLVRLLAFWRIALLGALSALSSVCVSVCPRAVGHSGI